MNKNIIKFSAALVTLSMLLFLVAIPNYVSADESESSDDAVTLVESVVPDTGTALSTSDISDSELLEAEPSELPTEAVSEKLTNRLEGRMLLDVQGKGEVYYIDPVTKGKEYLADGEAAQSLLRRRALGINENNFAKLTLGKDKTDSSVCKESALGRRLKGRIVLRVKEHGEAYWILPTNCRAYYAGTFEASYQLMKRFSLGITKKDLAKIPDNRRQKMKRALRLAVYARAQKGNMSLKVARTEVKSEVEAVKACVGKFKTQKKLSANKSLVSPRMSSRVYAKLIRSCVQKSNLPQITKNTRNKIRIMIKETRKARAEIRKIRRERPRLEKERAELDLEEIDMHKVMQRVKEEVERLPQKAKRIMNRHHHATGTSESLED